MTLTTQELFNRVTEHLVKQNEKSIRITGGTYNLIKNRGENGHESALGCLIPDSLWKPDMNNHSLPYEFFEKFPEMHEIVSKNDLYLLDYLEYIHSHYDSSSWKGHFAFIGKSHNLTLPECLK